MKTITQLSLAALLIGPGALATAWQGAPAQDTPPAPKVELTPEEEAAALEARATAEEAQRTRAGEAFKIADYDHNGWISFREMHESLDVDRPRFLVYDKDRNGKVTPKEFIQLCIETYQRYGVFKIPTPNPADPTAQALLEGLNGDDAPEGPVEYVPVEASSILELFGQPILRVAHTGSVPQPHQLVGPVPSFRRLDVNNNGGIGVDDISVLLLGAGLDERPKSLVASLDTDGDGQISLDEFKQCMAGRAK